MIPSVHWRQVAGVCGVLLAMAAGCAVLGGCQRIGGSVRQDAAKVEVDNPSPNTLTLRDRPDGESQWTSNGTGPSQFTDLTSEGVQTFRQGSVPREVLWDGTSRRFLLSSGADVTAKGVEVDPQTGIVKVAEFSTSASEPIRAGNEALDRLAPVWINLTQAERDAAIAQIEASTQIAESLKPALIVLLESLLK